MLSSLLPFLNSLFSLLFFHFRAILSPCLFYSFPFFHPHLISCPSALFHQLIWLVCLSYLRVISTTVAETGLNWVPIVQFKCRAGDSHHPQEFILWMGKKTEANWVSQVLQQFSGGAGVSAEVSQPGLLSVSLVPVLSVIILPLCVKVHSSLLAVLIICPCRTNLGNGGGFVLFLWCCFPRVSSPKLRHPPGFAHKNVLLCVRQSLTSFQQSMEEQSWNRFCSLRCVTAPLCKAWDTGITRNNTTKAIYIPWVQTTEQTI